MSILWAVIALLALGAMAGLLGLLQRRNKKEGTETEEDESTTLPHGEGCCGMHITCEADSLLAAVSKEIVYYDDEELDVYKGVASNAYSSKAIDEFHEVLVTLDEDDVPSWIRSLQLRGIELPDELKPEAFLIVGEHREHDHHDHHTSAR